MSDSIENSNSVAETADGTDSLTTLSPEHVDVKQQNYLNEIKDLKVSLIYLLSKNYIHRERANISYHTFVHSLSSFAER